MTPPLIAFVGGGNMAESLIGGLLARGHPAERLRVADPAAERRERLAARGVPVQADNEPVLPGADWVVLAVKPQVVPAVARQIAPRLESHTALVSIAAGVPTAAFARWFGPRRALVRAMPNTPALVGEGATALFANDAVTPAQRDQAEALFAAVGATCWVEEEAHLDAVTALSGSGPAYFFLLVEVLAQAGADLGLPAAVARQLAAQTLQGSAALLKREGVEPAELRRRVTSPGGTTERALAVLAEEGFAALVGRAVAAARERARELAGEIEP
ncbi:MAG: pyrroline-5-carboxylate reductase [Porticoccaceae bacterium]|nr:MAG: pyrroline-5-carboxylate reductase [Porticoccaceae bacterium]